MTTDQELEMPLNEIREAIELALKLLPMSRGRGPRLAAEVALERAADVHLSRLEQQLKKMKVIVEEARFPRFTDFDAYVTFEMYDEAIEQGAQLGVQLTESQERERVETGRWQKALAVTQECNARIAGLEAAIRAVHEADEAWHQLGDADTLPEALGKLYLVAALSQEEVK